MDIWKIFRLSQLAYVISYEEEEEMESYSFRSNLDLAYYIIYLSL